VTSFIGCSKDDSGGKLIFSSDQDVIVSIFTSENTSNSIWKSSGLSGRGINSFEVKLNEGNYVLRYSFFNEGNDGMEGFQIREGKTTNIRYASGSGLSVSLPQ
ncbi:MAG: hypothetical protein LIO85_00870, partial [Rikenellaceae bacterium]|nr:hypothetical protein [Rikenellaceae bacterium]